MPALLKTRLTRPWSRTTSSAHARTSASLETSSRRVVTFTFAFLIPAAAAARPSSLTSARARWHPRRASPCASARPIPEAAPVTAATFPSKERVRTSPLHRLEVALGRPAVGADPVRREVFEGGAGRDAGHGVSLRGVVDVAAHLALVLSLHVRGPPHGFIPEISSD